jgi:hypothetical protein
MLSPLAVSTFAMRDTHRKASQKRDKREGYNIKQ